MVLIQKNTAFLVWRQEPVKVVIFINSIVKQKWRCSMRIKAREGLCAKREMRNKDIVHNIMAVFTTLSSLVLCSTRVCGAVSPHTDAGHAQGPGAAPLLHQGNSNLGDSGHGNGSGAGYLASGWRGNIDLWPQKLQGCFKIAEVHHRKTTSTCGCVHVPYVGVSMQINKVNSLTYFKCFTNWGLSVMQLLLMNARAGCVRGVVEYTYDNI